MLEGKEEKSSKKERDGEERGHAAGGERIEGAKRGKKNKEEGKEWYTGGHEGG